MLGSHPSIDMGQSTEYAKEMVKHEAFHTKYGPPLRPYQFREFPKRMYRCAHVVGKGIEIEDATTANDEHEERNFLSRGFCSSLQDAHDEAKRTHTEHAKLAAEREYEIAHGRLSPQATAEVRAAEREHGSVHLPAMPAGPVKRPVGRPKSIPAPG